MRDSNIVYLLAKKQEPIDTELKYEQVLKEQHRRNFANKYNNSSDIDQQELRLGNIDKHPYGPIDSNENSKAQSR